MLTKCFKTFQTFSGNQTLGKARNGPEKTIYEKSLAIFEFYFIETQNRSKDTVESKKLQTRLKNSAKNM